MFNDLDFSSWQWIVSQVFGLVGLVIIIIAFQMRVKTRTLLMFALFHTVSLGMHGFTGNWLMFSLAVASIARNLSFTYIEIRGEKFPKKLSIAVVIFFVVINIPIAIWNWVNPAIDSHWVDWVILGTILFNNFAVWLKGIHLMRLANISLSIVLVINGIMFYNGMMIVIELFVMSSIVVFYIRFFRDRRKRAKLGTEPVSIEEGSISENSINESPEEIL